MVKQKKKLHFNKDLLREKLGIIMRNFQQFLESTPNTMNPHLNHLREIENIIEQQKQKISRLVEQNNVYLKALAKIKIDLERALKDKSKLNDAVYGSINLARGLTPYSKPVDIPGGGWQLDNVKDPPLSDAEKTLGELMMKLLR